MALHFSINHAPLPLLRVLLEYGLYPALKHISFPQSEFLTCAGFHQDKLSQSPHQPSPFVILRSGEFLASDTIGDITSPSGRSHQHIVTFLNLTSQYIIARKIQSRWVFSTFIPAIINFIDQLHQKTPSRFHSDDYLGYKSRIITSILTHNRTIHTYTSPYQPQSNLNSERINRILLDSVRSSLAHSLLPPYFSDYALIDAIFKYNLIPSPN